MNWPHIKEDKQNKVHGKAENVSYGRLNVELFIVHAAALSSSVALFCFISRIIESPNDLQYHNWFTILLKFPNPEVFNWSRNCFFCFYNGFEAVLVNEARVVIQKVTGFFFLNFMNHNNNKKTWIIPIFFWKSLTFKDYWNLLVGNLWYHEVSCSTSKISRIF